MTYMPLECLVFWQQIEEDNNFVFPRKNHEDDAGYDLAAYLPQGGMDLFPGETIKIPTNLRVAIQSGFYGQIEARSGWATKRTTSVPCGVIDAGFRGHLHVALHNDGNDLLRVEHGDRVGQIVFLPLPKVKTVVLDQEDSLPESVRGDQGYGSSGF